MAVIPSKRFSRYPRPLQGGAQVLSGGGQGQQLGLAGSYQNAFNRANAANKKRYRNILSGYDKLRGRVMGDLKNTGAAERGDINREFQNVSSNAYQGLVNRGFGNASLNTTLQQGVSREKTAAYGRLNDRLVNQRARFDTGITQGKLGVMERRYDNGPDYNQMIALSQGLGRSGYPPGGMYQPAFNQDGFADAYQNARQRALQIATFQQGGLRRPTTRWKDKIKADRVDRARGRWIRRPLRRRR